MYPPTHIFSRKYKLSRINTSIFKQHIHAHAHTHTHTHTHVNKYKHTCALKHTLTRYTYTQVQHMYPHPPSHAQKLVTHKDKHTHRQAHIPDVFWTSSTLMRGRTLAWANARAEPAMPLPTTIKSHICAQCKCKC